MLTRHIMLDSLYTLMPQCVPVDFFHESLYIWHVFTVFEPR